MDSSALLNLSETAQKHHQPLCSPCPLARSCDVCSQISREKHMQHLNYDYSSSCLIASMLSLTVQAN